MRRDRKVLLAAMLGATVMAAPAVSIAQARGETGWYAGASIGQTKYKDTCTGCDDKDTAFKILGGYHINRTFGVELGYTDLGKSEGAGQSVKASAWEVVGIGAFPVANNFSVYGKLGVFRAETKGSAPGFSAKEDNSDLTYGAGVQYDFSRDFGVRGEWQRYGKVGGGAIGKSDIDVISVGVVWNFR